MAQHKIIEAERERERKRKTREKARKEALAREPRRGKSVAEFCASWGVSRSTYEEWRRRGIGPTVIQPIPGGRVLITSEAEVEWASKRSALAAVADPAE